MISPRFTPTAARLSLANSVREALLPTDHAKGLLVADALFFLQVSPDCWLPFSTIYRLLSDNCGTSYGMVYQGLQCRRIFQRRKSAGVAHRRGARPYLYRVPHPDELQAEFAPHARQTPGDRLRKCDFKNLTTYRMGLHHALYVRRWCNNGGQGFMMSRGLMASRLGVSERTVRTYDQRLGHSHDPNYQETPIHWHNWDSLPRYKERFSPTGERLPSKQWLKVVDWDQGGQTTCYPRVKYLAYQALKKGQTVLLVERLPNTYYPYLRPDLGTFEADQVADHYLAEKAAQRAAGLHQDPQGQWYYQRE